MQRFKTKLLEIRSGVVTVSPLLAIFRVQHYVIQMQESQFGCKRLDFGSRLTPLATTSLTGTQSFPPPRLCGARETQTYQQFNNKLSCLSSPLSGVYLSICFTLVTFESPSEVLLSISLKNRDGSGIFGRMISLFLWKH